MSTSVKYFHSAMLDAPVLSGTAGTLIGVLDACLVTGFSVRAVDSITVTGEVAVGLVSGGHGYEVDAVLLLAGASETALNGEKRLTAASATTFTFAAPGVADGTYTGTISAKIAPAGWSKAFSGTNLAAYRADDLTSTRLYLRVDDTAAQNARVVGYETMSDINTGTGPFPTSAQVSGGGWWPKASAAGATARGWTIVADGALFYIHLHTPTSLLGVSGSVFCFGDFISYKGADQYRCVLNAPNVDSSAAATLAAGSLESLALTQTYSGAYTPRSYTALGSAVNGLHYAESYVTTQGTSGQGLSAGIPSYPNPIDNAIYFTRKLIGESSGLRGVYPGIVAVPHNCHSAFSWRDKIAGQGNYAGRKLMAVKCGSPASTSSQGVVFFDITGPWR